MSLRFLILVLFLINSVFVNITFSQEEVDEEIGQSIIDILKDVLPHNPDRIMELDEKTGSLIIQDTPSNHKIIRQVVRALDREPPQVDIETRFVELKFTDTDEFGVNWGNTFVWYDWTSPKGVGGDYKWRMRGLDPATRTIGNLITFATTTSTGLDLSIAKLNTANLDLFLHALEKSDKANLLSSPRVTTIGGQLANIQIITTVPYISDEDIVKETGQDDYHNITMDEVSLGIKLEVKPTVGEAGIITLELRPEVEVLANQLTLFENTSLEELGWPVVDTRSLKTTVQVKSGETVILGGLMNDDNKVYNKKVPLLGDIPLLGNLFRHKYVTRIKKNLLIFVTATLVSPAGEVIE